MVRACGNPLVGCGFNEMEMLAEFGTPVGIVSAWQSYADVKLYGSRFHSTVRHDRF
jgi:hypothetical protein